MTTTRPKRPIVVRNSELQDGRHCPLKHRLGWLLGWQSAASEASHLGTCWHEVLELHYRTIKFWQTNHPDDYSLIYRRPSRVTDNVWKWLDSGTFEDNTDLLAWMYTGYLDVYGLDEDWEILRVEETNQVPFRTRDGGPTDFVLSWTSDLLVRERFGRGNVLVIDNKSAKRLLGPTGIDLSDQFGNYTWAWRRLGMPVFAQKYNGARTEKLKRPMALSERFVRLPGYRTDRELVEIEQDSLAVAEFLYSKANLRQPFSVPDPSVCGWKCDFENLHIRMRKQGILDPKPSLMRSMGFEQRS